MNESPEHGVAPPGGLEPPEDLDGDDKPDIEDEEDDFGYVDLADEQETANDITQENGAIPAVALDNHPSSGNPALTDPAESESATLSANTVEADEIDLGEGQENTENGDIDEINESNAVVPNGQEDEIDYDDEDEADLTEHEVPAVLEAASESKGGSVKRPRTDMGEENVDDNAQGMCLIFSNRIESLLISI